MAILNESPTDAFNRPLHEGDAVQVVHKGPVVFRVAALQPNLDPRAPDGSMVVHLIAMVSLNVRQGKHHDNLIRIGTLEEFGPMPIALTDIKLRVE